MDFLQSYDDHTDTTVNNNELTPTIRTEADNPSIVPFQMKTLTFAAFPWTTPFPMYSLRL